MSATFESLVRRTRSIREDGLPVIPTQITPIEAWALRKAVEGRRNVLEVGSAWGFSTVLLAQEAALVVAVDPHTDFDTWVPFLVNLERYGVQSRVMAVRGRSEYELPCMREWGAERFFDLAFIDGDHGEVIARSDLVWAKRLVRAGGLIAVHDYTIRWPGVVEAVEAELAGLPAWRVQRLYLAVNE